MYNEQRFYPFPNPPRYPRFAELEDAQFWADIAAQTGIPPQQYHEFVQEVPSWAHSQPQQPIIVEGFVTYLPEEAPANTLLPAQPNARVVPSPTTPSASGTPGNEVTEQRTNWFTQFGLWGLAILLLGSVLGGLLAPSHPTGSPNTSFSVAGNPSVSADFINTILNNAGSPAAGKGQAMYDLGVQYGIDPVFALAFFKKESSFGKAGMATITLGLGNERCLNDRPCINTSGAPCQAGQSCYARFYSWEDGFDHWYALIKHLYVEEWGLSTIEQIVPKYAPGADNNNEREYIQFVEDNVAIWRTQYRQQQAAAHPLLVERINQLDPKQYNSTQEYDTWANSACSAATMTEYINALNAARGSAQRYRVTDILAQEIDTHSITPALGLLEPAGIDRTVARFGLKAAWLRSPSVADLVASANQGKPVIVGIPPDRLAGGHLMIVRGGDAQNVFLVDSSSRNWQSLSYTDFQGYWRDFAVRLEQQ